MFGRRDNDDLQRLTAWRTTADGLRSRLIASAWRHGERNVAKLAKAIGVSRDTVYADLREQGIDYRDRKAPTVSDDGLLDYEYVSERRLDAILASNAIPIGLQAFVDGYNPQTRGGRCRLLESMLDQPATEADDALVRREASLRRGRVDVPEVGEVAVWQGSTTRSDGTTVGLGLIGLPGVSDDGPAVMLLLLGAHEARDAAAAKLSKDAVSLVQWSRLGDENPREIQYKRSPEPEELQRGVANLAEVIAEVPTLPAQHHKQCLLISHGTATTPGLAWGDAVVDEVEIATPLWIYSRIGQGSKQVPADSAPEKASAT